MRYFPFYSQMKIIRFLLFFTILFFFSCESKTKDKKIKQMESSLRTYLLGENSDLQGISLEHLKMENYDYLTSNENTVDSLRLSIVKEKINYFKTNLETYLRIENLTNQLVDLSSSSVNKALDNKAMNELYKNRDSLNIFSQIDSIIKERVENRKHPENVYKAKFLIKGTVLLLGEKIKIIDTLNYYFDRNLKILDLNKFD